MEDMIFEEAMVTVKFKNLVEAIKTNLGEDLKVKSEADYKVQQEKHKSDDLYILLTLISKEVSSTHKEYFENAAKKRLVELCDKKYSYVGYTEERIINARTTEFLVDNTDYTFKDLYTFVTKELLND